MEMAKSRPLAESSSAQRRRVKAILNAYEEEKLGPLQVSSARYLEVVRRWSSSCRRRRMRQQQQRLQGSSDERIGMATCSTSNHAWCSSRLDQAHLRRRTHATRCLRSTNPRSWPSALSSGVRRIAGGPTRCSTHADEHLARSRITEEVRSKPDPAVGETLEVASRTTPCPGRPGERATGS